MFVCKLCVAPGAISLPDDIAIREAKCSACGRAQLVNRYARAAGKSRDRLVGLIVVAIMMAMALARGDPLDPTLAAGAWFVAPRACPILGLRAVCVARRVAGLG